MTYYGIAFDKDELPHVDAFLHHFKDFLVTIAAATPKEEWPNEIKLAFHHAKCLNPIGSKYFEDKHKASHEAIKKAMRGAIEEGFRKYDSENKDGEQPG